MGNNGKVSLSLKHLIIIFALMLVGFMGLKSFINHYNRWNNHFLQTAIMQMYDGNATMEIASNSEFIEEPLTRKELLKKSYLICEK